MNYYYPYMFMPYNATNAVANTGGLFSRLLGNGINFSSILSGTQKTLGLVNQVIPVVKQVTPVMKNAKTMFRVMNEFKKVDTPVSNKMVNQTGNTLDNSNIETETNMANASYQEAGPTFFI